MNVKQLLAQAIEELGQVKFYTFVHYLEQALKELARLEAELAECKRQRDALTDRMITAGLMS